MVLVDMVLLDAHSLEELQQFQLQKGYLKK
jgi:hypothetical protein